MPRATIDSDHEFGSRMTGDEMISLRGIGWDGDLDAMRDDAPATW